MPRWRDAAVQSGDRGRFRRESGAARPAVRPTIVGGTYRSVTSLTKCRGRAARWAIAAERSERLTILQPDPMILVCRSLDPAEREGMVTGKSAAASRATRQWHIIDADGKVLGRMATMAARLLQGKHKPTWAALPRQRRPRRHRQRGDGEADRPEGRTEALPATTAATKAGCAKSAPRSSARRTRCGWSKKRCAACCRRPSSATAMYRKLKVYARADHPHAAQKPQKLEVA